MNFFEAMQVLYSGGAVQSDFKLTYKVIDGKLRWVNDDGTYDDYNVGMSSDEITGIWTLVSEGTKPAVEEIKPEANQDWYKSTITDLIAVIRSMEQRKATT